MDFLSAGRDGITEADIDLDRKACSGDCCVCRDAHAIVLVLGAYARCLNGRQVKLDAVVGGERQDALEGFLHLIGVTATEGKEIGVPGGTSRIRLPRQEKQATFQDKAVPVLGNADAVKQAFQTDCVQIC